jgi:RNA polymerase primary sigma factor/RNA polymerase sigma factor
VLATAAWLRSRGRSFPEIGAILDRRGLKLPDADQKTDGRRAARLVEAYRAIARQRVEALDPRKKDTASVAIRMLDAANFDLAAIASVLNERRIPWRDPRRADDGDDPKAAAETSSAGVPKARWTPRRVAAELASRERPGAIYHPDFTEREKMAVILAEAERVRRAAMEQYDEAMRRPKADRLYAMRPRSEDEQRALFLAMNYWRHEAILARERRGPFPLRESDPRPDVAYDAQADAIFEVLHRSNTRLVRQAAKRFVTEYELDDLIGEGQIALRKAVVSFDVRRGFKFSTWATKLIQNIYLRMRKSDLTKSRAGARNNVSMHGTGSEPELSWEFEDKKSTAPLRALLESEGVGRLLRALDQLEKIDERKVLVLRLRFGLLDGAEHTLKEIGEKLGVTREWVRQIEAAALEELAVLLAKPAPAPAVVDATGER